MIYARIREYFPCKSQDVFFSGDYLAGRGGDGDGLFGSNCNEQFLPLPTRCRAPNFDLQEETGLGAQRAPDEKWKF